MYDWSNFSQTSLAILRFQLLLKGCTIEAVVNGTLWLALSVSVVVERMYDWSFRRILSRRSAHKFQLLLKGCTIEASKETRSNSFTPVSVVVERMYDWSKRPFRYHLTLFLFQLLLKGCTIEAAWPSRLQKIGTLFQLLLKGCTIEARHYRFFRRARLCFSCCWKDVRLKHNNAINCYLKKGFSCCWKDVRLKH